MVVPPCTPPDGVVTVLPFDGGVLGADRDPDGDLDDDADRDPDGDAVDGVGVALALTVVGGTDGSSAGAVPSWIRLLRVTAPTAVTATRAAVATTVIRRRVRCRAVAAMEATGGGTKDSCAVLR
jgi:hypothetical protein